MTYYPDLHTATMLGSGDQLRAIGWLHPSQDYSRGAVPDDLLATLKEHIQSAFQTCAFGGWHDCEFCDNCMGSSNLIVPATDAVYVAPAMIVHYITHHEYRPPDEFFAALQSCPAQKSPEYMALLAPFFSYFRFMKPNPFPPNEQRSDTDSA